MNWFTADLHVNHANIIRYCSRPFADVQEMNETLIRNWNDRIRENDTVYILGDFGFGNVKPVLEVLKGKKHLIIGSHDSSTLQCKRFFDSISSLLEIKIGNMPVTLCHYCMRVWPKSHYNSYHLYGHSHGRLEPVGKSWDVGVDCNGFCPLSEGEIISIMKNRPDNPNLVQDRWK